MRYARVASDNVLRYLDAQIEKPDRAKNLYLTLVGTYVGADGFIDRTEYEFCKKVFSYRSRYDRFCELVNECSTADQIERIRNLLDVAPKDVRSDFVLFGVAICACNERITDREQQLLSRYLHP